MFPDLFGLARTLGIAAAAFVVGGVIAYPLGHKAGVEAERVAAINRTLEQLEERGLINEEVRDLGACDLLAELGGLSDECAP